MPTTTKNDQALTDVLTLLKESLDPVTKAKEMAKAVKPQNESPPRISSLNPQGDKDYPRPALPFRKIYVPYEAEPEDFTWEELELMALLETGSYIVKRNDNSKVPITVEVTTNALTKKPEALWIVSELGFSTENRALMPPMANYLRQILGDKAKAILTMEDRREMVSEGALPVSVGA
jgi:hypothetical protein